MITDKQIEAAARALSQLSPADWENTAPHLRDDYLSDAKAALEAAEAVAWSDDMGAAPKGLEAVTYYPAAPSGKMTLPPMMKVERLPAVTPRKPTHYRVIGEPRAPSKDAAA